MERTLRERGEGPDRLDLVAEELDPEGFSPRRGKDVDQTATDRELAAFLDALHPLIAREREAFGEQLDPRLFALLDLDRRRPGFARRQSLGKRGCRGADEPSVREHVERPRTLADEVRRRLEPRAPADATARQQPDAVFAEEPGRGIGRIAGVGILGQNADESAAEPLVCGRQEQREGRFGDTRASRQRCGEGGKPLVLDELGDEGMQDRSVHHKRRNPRFRARNRSRGASPVS
jgi:hypothetical protein